MSFLGKQTNEILLRIKQGDEASKNELFNFTYNHLIIVAQKYLNNKSNAEDVVSSAYLKAFSYINSFESTQDGYNWLCKIVQNLCFDFNKKDKQWVPFEKVANIAHSIDIETHIEKKDTIQTYLSSYSEQEQYFIYLRFWENRSFAEIAKLTGRKKSYVHKRVSKILKEIFEKIEKEKK